MEKPVHQKTSVGTQPTRLGILIKNSSLIKTVYTQRVSVDGQKLCVLYKVMFFLSRQGVRRQSVEWFLVLRWALQPFPSAFFYLFSVQTIDPP